MLFPWLRVATFLYNIAVGKTRSCQRPMSCKKKSETNVLSFKQESQVLLSVIVGTHGNGTALRSEIVKYRHFSQ